MDFRESVKDRVQRLIGDLNDEITFLNGCIIDTDAKLKEALEEQKKINAYVEKLHREMAEYKSQKTDAICTKLALSRYSKSDDVIFELLIK